MKFVYFLFQFDVVSQGWTWMHISLTAVSDATSLKLDLTEGVAAYMPEWTAAERKREQDWRETKMIGEETFITIFSLMSFINVFTVCS